MKIVGAAVTLLVIASIGLASAEEIHGKIRTLDQTGRAFTLEDGTQIWVAEGVSMAPLREGVSVNAAYEERDGKKICIRVGVITGGAAAGRTPR